MQSALPAAPTAISTSPAPCRSSHLLSKAGSASIPSNGSGCTAAGVRKTSNRSTPGLDLRPKPIEDALRFLIACAHRVEPAHGSDIRIDAFVIDHGLVDEFLAGKIAIGVSDEVAVLRRDFRPQQIVDKGERLCDMGSVLR